MSIDNELSAFFHGADRCDIRQLLVMENKLEQRMEDCDCHPCRMCLSYVRRLLQHELLKTK